MTREEAINIMSQMIKDEEGFLSDNTVEAHKMAIKALEQEPCGNAINRQWLMECVNEGWIKFDTEKDENRFIHLVRDIAPPVNPQNCDKCEVGNPCLYCKHEFEPQESEEV